MPQVFSDKSVDSVIREILQEVKTDREKAYVFEQVQLLIKDGKSIWIGHYEALALKQLIVREKCTPDITTIIGFVAFLHSYPRTSARSDTKS